MRKTGWRVLVVGAVAILGGAWIQFTRVPVDAASAALQVNSPAPDFSLASLDGRRVALGDLRGQVVMLNFWATWCVPCRAEMPEIQSAYKDYRGQGFTVLAIDVGEDEAAVAGFAQDLGLVFPILLDRDGAVTRLYRVRALPTTYFLDRTGTIRTLNVGPMSRAYITTQLVDLLKAGR